MLCLNHADFVQIGGEAAGQESYPFLAVKAELCHAPDYPISMTEGAVVVCYCSFRKISFRSGIGT